MFYKKCWEFDNDDCIPERQEYGLDPHLLKAIINNYLATMGLFHNISENIRPIIFVINDSRLVDTTSCQYDQ